MARVVKKTRVRMNGRRAALAAALFVACAKAPPPPPLPMPPPAGPHFEIISLAEAPLNLARPGALAPRLRWTPVDPSEGTLTVLTIEPSPRGQPLFEARARTDERPIPLAPLRGGGYLGLVAAPIGKTEVPIEINVTLIDGTRISQSLTLRIAKRNFPATRLSVARRFTAPDAPTLERIRRERELVRATLRQVSPVPLWKGPFVLPLEGPTTSPYGQRRLFNNELRSRHTGHDIDGDTGDPVYASNDGRIALSHDLFYSGQAVYLDHGLGFFTAYFHLSERLVSDGQWVEKGQLIGRVGATGRVTGPHLHWSAFLRGQHLDPLSLLEPGFARESERLFLAPAGLAVAP